MTTKLLACNPLWFFPNYLGKFLANGKMYTYRDVARSEFKAVYYDEEGTAAYPNPIELGASGQINTSIYWSEDENYYVEIRDENDVVKYFFENFNAPGASSSDVNTILQFKNQIINGQFRFFVDSLFQSLSSGNTSIAYNWFFTKNNTSATDRIEFKRFNLGQTDVEANPVYYMEYNCAAPGSGELYKDIRLYIPDVNTLEGREVTLSFEGASSLGSTISALFIQNFGTGGSPSAEVVTPVESFVLTEEWDKYSATFTVPSTGGKTRGTDDNDCVQIAFRVPLNLLCNFKLTNSQLIIGAKAPDYDYNDESIERGRTLGSKLPDPSDRSDLNKRVAVGTVVNAGVTEQAYTLISDAGTITEYAGVDGLPADSLWCDGATTDSTVQNRKYYNLWTKIFNQYGVGTDGFFGIASDDNLSSLITNQYSGAVTAAADVSTTMTVTTERTGTTGYFETVFEFSYPITLDAGGARTASSTIYLRCFTNGAVTSPADVSTTMTMGIGFQGTATWKADLYITTVAGSAIPAGSYFNIYNPAGTQYAVWFRVSGVGSAPSVPGATLVQVDILTGDTAVQVATKILRVLSGSQVTKIVAKAGSAIPAGSYLTINGNTRQWYVWFKVNGVGDDPEVVGKTGIPVSILTTDTAAQVQAKITAEIPSVLYKVPNRNNGVFPRGGPVSPTSNVDPDFADRNGGNTLGSLQASQNLAHTHPLNYPPGAANFQTSGTSAFTPGSNWGLVAGASIGSDGGNQSNPVNTYTRYIIKY